MIKSHNKTIGVIAIFLMLGASPLSVTYSFADIENNQKEGLGVLLTEEIVNGKLEVRHYALPDNTTEEDMQRRLSFEGQTSSWAYVNYQVYHSGIIIFDGKASKVGDNLWEISTNDVIDQTVTDEDLSYRIVFSGKAVETDEENVIAISFMNSSLKNPEMGQNIKFSQIGELTIISEKPISSNQEFRNSTWVK